MTARIHKRSLSICGWSAWLLPLAVLLIASALAACAGDAPTPRPDPGSPAREDSPETPPTPTEREDEASSPGVLGRIGQDPGQNEDTGRNEDTARDSSVESRPEEEEREDSGGVISRLGDGGGSGGGGRVVAPGAVKFVSVSAGYDHTCAITNEGSIVCWGNNSYGQATSRGGDFVDVTVGLLHTCALTKAGGVLCWGDEDVVMTEAPPGQFRSISNGGRYNCGVKTDGSIECWGWILSYRDWSPEGEFTAVSVRGNKCALRTDGTVTCSLNDPVEEEQGQSPAPRCHSTLPRGIAHAGSRCAHLHPHPHPYHTPRACVAGVGPHRPARGTLRVHQRWRRPHLRADDRRLRGLLGPQQDRLPRRRARGRHAPRGPVLGGQRREQT